MTTTIRQLIGTLSLLCAAFALAATATAPARAGPAYGAPQTLDRPGWAQTQLWDVNDGRQVVGTSFSADGSISAGFVLNNGSYTDIGPAGALYSGATGITNSGLIVGYYGDGDPMAPTDHAFLYENGSYTEFRLPGATNTFLRGVSSDGRFLTGSWDDGTSGRIFAFDRQTNRRTDIKGSIVQGVSVQGLVVGSLLNVTSHAFTFNLNTQATTEVIATDAGNRPRFRGINDGGLITGFDSGSGKAFVGEPGHWTVFDAPGGMASIVGYGLNNQGDLVGFTIDSAGLVHGFYAVPVPEPAQWWLVALGMAALPLLRRLSR